MAYVCNGFKFEKLADATAYANFYFRITRVILGIEEVKNEPKAN